MGLQVNIFLLLFGGLQGLLLSLFLAKKKLVRGGYLFLLIYFGVMLLQITLKVMSKLWLMTNWTALYQISYFLPLLYGPLLWLFVRELLFRTKFRPVDLLHFLPFLVLSVDTVLRYPLYYSVASWTSLLYASHIEMPIQVISILGYHVLALNGWYQHRTSLETYYSETHRLQLNWLRQFIIASWIVCTVIAVAIYFIYITYPVYANFRFAFIILTVFIYWVSYTALTRPTVFSLVRANADSAHPAFVPSMVVHRPVKKYSNSGLTENEIKRIRVIVEKISRETKPYLNPSLTIQELAQLVRCNRHQLSQVLNESMHKSFYDYVNGCRVEEAKALLLDPSRSAHKIASLAYDAGFNSISTFNDVFRKSTGLTPSQFRKRSLEQMAARRG